MGEKIRGNCLQLSASDFPSFSLTRAPATRTEERIAHTRGKEESDERPPPRAGRRAVVGSGGARVKVPVRVFPVGLGARVGGALSRGALPVDHGGGIDERRQLLP